MSNHQQEQKKQQILELLQELPHEVAEKALEEMMWMLDDIWRQEGISSDAQQRLDTLLHQSSEHNEKVS